MAGVAMVSRRLLATRPLATGLLLLFASPVRASGDDHWDAAFRSETYAQVFRRALLPADGGAITETQVPVYESVHADVYRIDGLSCVDCLDVSLAAWGASTFSDESGRVQADVQTANVLYHPGRFRLRVGRQTAAGGAARYTRFDGAEAGGSLPLGIDGSIYGGWTVLPRWNEQRGYFQLGSATHTLLRNPELAEPTNRNASWVAGGRFGWSSDASRAGLSFHHEQEPTGIAHRTLGGSGRLAATESTVLGASGLLELDAARVSEARGWVDWAPASSVDVSVEALHTEPALFLSRQSVLSVFSTEGYEEFGSIAVYRTSEQLRFEGGGWIEIYDATDRGARGEGTVVVSPTTNTSVRASGGRLLAPSNGYLSGRVALQHHFEHPVTGTIDLYAFRYDQAIRGHGFSAFASATLGYQLARAFELLLGASLAQSPYAKLDAQTLLRLSYQTRLGGT